MSILLPTCFSNLPNPVTTANSTERNSTAQVHIITLPLTTKSPVSLLRSKGAGSLKYLSLLTHLQEMHLSPGSQSHLTLSLQQKSPITDLPSTIQNSLCPQMSPQTTPTPPSTYSTNFPKSYKPLLDLERGVEGMGISWNEHLEYTMVATGHLNVISHN